MKLEKISSYWTKNGEIKAKGDEGESSYWAKGCGPSEKWNATFEEVGKTVELKDRDVYSGAETTTKFKVVGVSNGGYLVGYIV